MRKRILGPLLVFGLLLVACGTQGEVFDEINEQLTVPNVDATAVPTDPPPPTATAEEEVADSPTEEAVEAESDVAFPPFDPPTDVEIFTTDDRSSQLSGRTGSWNTNWERRTISTEELRSGGPPRDGIPSIDDPQFVTIADAEDFLVANEPVVLVDINNDARAYPLSIITWHEIVNDEVGGQPVVVTFCPLCNSAVVFDRNFNGVTLEFGVSGLLRNSDLIMYDRTTETLWQQFTGDGLIGDWAGGQLTFLSSQIISFENFKDAYPEGLVLSEETGFNRAYGLNPYAGYDTYDNMLSSNGNFVLFGQETDGRLGAADRVVTVSLEEQGIDIAYPVALLAAVGVINDQQGDQALAIFHEFGTSSALGAEIIAEGEDVGATGVFDPNLNDQLLTFAVVDGEIVDNESGSTWNIVGQAIAGPLAGEQLTRIVSADHFWFSWAAFRPDTIIYTE